MKLEFASTWAVQFVRERERKYLFWPKKDTGTLKRFTLFYVDDARYFNGVNDTKFSLAYLKIPIVLKYERRL